MLVAKEVTIWDYFGDVLNFINDYLIETNKKKQSPIRDEVGM